MKKLTRHPAIRNRPVQRKLDINGVKDTGMCVIGVKNFMIKNCALMRLDALDRVSAILQGLFKKFMAQPTSVRSVHTNLIWM